jgi:hypothetical protein
MPVHGQQFEGSGLGGSTSNPGRISSQAGPSPIEIAITATHPDQFIFAMDFIAAHRLFL